MASRGAAPAELVLDFDATHVPPHGQLDSVHSSAHYDTHCYPLYVFVGQDMLGLRAVRRGWRDPASIAGAAVKLPEVRL